MIRMRSSTKYVIVIAVFLASVAIGIQKSNIQNSFGESQVSVDTEDAQKLFEQSSHFKKIRMGFRPGNFEEAKTAIINELNKDVITRKYWDATGNYIILVSEIPDSIATPIIAKLRSINGLVEDKIYTDSEQDILINVEEHLENKQLVKERLKSDLSNPERRMTDQSVASSERQLTKLQTEIDSLSNQVQIHKQRKDRSLLFLTAAKVQKGNRFLSSLKDFSLTTLLMLVVFTIGLLIFYFVMVLFLRLMKKLGIRTAQGTGNYSYNYNKYYGYGARNKRIKRIYKDKKPSEEEEDK